MRHITVMECFESIRISDKVSNGSITNKEADELEVLIKRDKLDEANIVLKRDSITFINYVGYIKLSTVGIEILPKVNISNDIEVSRMMLINMLVKSKYLNINFSEISNLRLYKLNVNELLSLIFAKKLQKELVKGVYKEYVYVEEDTHNLKGNLIINNQIRNMAASKPKAYCRYEKFSIDNNLNQIFVYCINNLINSVRNVETIKSLMSSRAVLQDVNYNYIDDEMINFKFNRLNERFKDVFILAQMIILKNASTGNDGKDKSYSFLFKMNEVFEKYISNLVEEVIVDKKVYKQHEKYKLLVNKNNGQGIFKLKPDIVIEEDGREKIIIDTKWKRIDTSYNRCGVKREDLYQMYGYINRYKNSEKVILLYPRNNKVDEEKLGVFCLEDNKDKEIKIKVISLDYEGKTKLELKNIIENI